MTKHDLSLKIAQQAGADDVVAEQIVQAMLDAIISAFAACASANHGNRYE